MKRREKSQRIYVDTSVFGGCFDEEFSEHSIAFFDKCRTGRVVLIYSDTTLVELSAAPAHIRDILGHLPSEYLEYVRIDRETEDLAEAYLINEVVPKRMLPDAQHIAAATVARADVLVSWNFKHIVNLNRIHAFNAVNLRAGYPMLEIRSPREVLEYDDKDI